MSEQKASYRLLVVDDEDGIRALIRKYAEYEGHTVTEASDGTEAVDKAREQTFDLIIMDIMMPELDGFSASRLIRKSSDVPILMLSARGEEYDRIRGFELGVDDYVVKPFSPRELMLRVDAILKRAKPAARRSDEDVFAYEGLRVDFGARLVYVDGIRAELSPKEYDLLFYMVKNRNLALSRETLITRVWGYEFYGDDRTLDTHVKLLRRSLGAYSRCIVTVRSVGYRFEVPEK